MTTGFNIREGAEMITARILRDPDNWPSIAKDSRELERRIKFGMRLQVTRKNLYSWQRVA